MALSSCGPDDDLPPPNYPINDFIFNTFLFAEGSWWAFYDSTSGEFDTLTVTTNFGQYQNVYEGNKFVYSQFYYRGYWLRSKTNREYRIEYISKWVYDHNGRKITRIDINSSNNKIGNGSEALFFENTELQDSILGGFLPYQGTTYNSYFTLLESGDSLLYNNVWNVSQYRKFKISTSVTNDLSDVVYIFQEFNGPIFHNIGGNYTVVDKHVIPMIR